MTNYASICFFSNRLASKKIQTVRFLPILEFRRKIQVKYMSNYRSNLFMKLVSVILQQYLVLNTLSQELPLKVVGGQFPSTSIMLAFWKNIRDTSSYGWLFSHHQHFRKRHFSFCEVVQYRMINLKWREECIDLYMIDCNALDINDPRVVKFLDQVFCTALS